MKRLAQVGALAWLALAPALALAFDWEEVDRKAAALAANERTTAQPDALSFAPGTSTPRSSRSITRCRA